MLCYIILVSVIIYPPSFASKQLVPFYFHCISCPFNGSQRKLCSHADLERLGELFHWLS